MAYGTINTDKLVGSSGGILSPDSGVFRNRIINGAMAIDQRNAGASKSVSAATVTYVTDRWGVYASGAGVTAQQVASGITGFTNALQITGAASVTGLSLFQRIESKNIADAASSTVTLSAYVSDSTLTTATWYAYYANSSDNFGATTLIASGTWTINSTLTKYTAQISLPANAVNGVEIDINVGAQTSGTFTVTGVQLEKGSTATSFDYRPYGTELQLCQRYAIVYTTSANGDMFCNGYNNSTTVSFGILQLPVTMRTSPSITFNQSASYYGVYQVPANTVACSAVALLNTTTPQIVGLSFTSSGLTAGQGTVLKNAGTGTASITISAEL